MLFGSTQPQSADCSSSDSASMALAAAAESTLPVLVSVEVALCGETENARSSISGFIIANLLMSLLPLSPLMDEPMYMKAKRGATQSSVRVIGS